MADTSTCRVIIDPPGRGTWNMAVDEALLEQAAEGDVMSLRLYQWSEPTLSLGYFQSLADRRQHAASARCPVVRRPSGGGAILHDRELTYSLALPASHPLSRNSKLLYVALHDALIASLLPSRMPTEDKLSLRRWESSLATSTVEEPFLCFQRRSVGDVVLWQRIDDPIGYKVVGSAQRRRRGAILQHGSILLETSRYAPELPGLANLAGADWNSEGLAQTLSRTIPTQLDCCGTATEFHDDTRARAMRLEEEKYDTAGWLDRR